MPKGFKGTNAIGAPALWVPYMTYPVTTNGFFRELIEPNSRRGLVFNVTGRLKPGSSMPQAEANLKTIARQLEQEYPNENQGRNVTHRSAGAGDHQSRFPRQHRHGRRSADDDCGTRAPDRLRQRREPAAGASRSSAEGDRRAAVARREPEPAGDAAADRRNAAGARSAARSACCSLTGRRMFSGRIGRRSCSPTRSISTLTPACCCSRSASRSSPACCSAWRPPFSRRGPTSSWS